MLPSCCCTISRTRWSLRLGESASMNEQTNAGAARWGPVRGMGPVLNTSEHPVSVAKQP